MMPMDNESQSGCEPEVNAPPPGPTGPFVGWVLVLAFWCGIVAKTGLLGVGIAPVMLSAAAQAARRQPGRALVLVGTSAAAVALTTGDWQTALFSALGAAAGLLLGYGIAECWRYGRVAAATTALLFAVNALFLASIWGELEANAGRYETLVETQLERAESSAENSEEAAPAVNTELLEMYRWLIPEWKNILFGSAFATILIGVCLAVSAISWWVRRFYGLPGPRGSFLAMRPPDWLVWLVILTAAAWFADRRWPGALLRPVSWNIGLGLAAVYWLNGLGILLYGVRVLQAAPLMVGLVVAGIVCLGMQPVALLGLFDTWFDFRGRLDALAAARKERHDTEGPGS